MTVTLFAQPYDICARGFCFDDFETYTNKSKSLKNGYGQRVEEFELQFIDGDEIDCAFATAWGINQTNVSPLLDAVDTWEDWEKLHFIIAVGECGHDIDAKSVAPDDFDVDLYGVECLRELAEQFVDEGFFGDILNQFRSYIDYDAIARDLACDYSETVIAGTSYVYRCG